MWPFEFRCLGVSFAAIAVIIAWQPMSGQAEEEKSLRVMTYNIRFANTQDGLDVWEARRDRVAQEIAKGDIVGLQEVLKRQLHDIQSRAPGLQWYGVGREDGKEAGEYSPIGFRADRFELLASGTFWLSPTPDAVGSRGWDAALPRIASWVRLKDKSGTGPSGKGNWLILNTHFDHIGSQARTESAKLLLQQAKELKQDCHLVIMGDLNATEEAPPVQTLSAAKEELRNAREASLSPPQGPQGTWNGFQAIMDRRIDHIFVGPTVQVQKYEVLDPRTAANRFASDHLPVAVNLTATTTKSAQGLE